jgi:hypothetical protein
MALSFTKTPSVPVERSDARHRASLFKEDRPRRIDRFISFFGDDSDGRAESAEPLRDPFGGERWSER